MRFSENGLEPYFQPIIAIDQSGIMGYELLSRYVEGGEVKSLGSFYADPSISSDEKLETDRIVRRKGMVQFARFSSGNEKIFINIRIDWLIKYASVPEKLPTICWAKELGIAYDRIVIELSEEDFNAPYEKYSIPLGYYKTLGVLIAIDDYGVKGSNIHRVAEVSPDIIKIDMSLVQHSERGYQYRNFLKHTTALCEDLGIEVVYEGIENENQLKNCISSHGRYYQGFLLAKPFPTISQIPFNAECFKKSLYQNLIDSNDSKKKGDSIKSEMDTAFADFGGNSFTKPEKDIFDDCILREYTDSIPKYVKRIYICNRYGFQLSSNIEFGDTIHLIDKSGKNWAWRGYFNKALRFITDCSQSYLTAAYRNI